MSATEVIDKKVRDILGQDDSAQIHWESTGIGKSKILRVITNKWKGPAWQRAWKLQSALEKQLTQQQWDNIFRVSVLTGDEFKRLNQILPNPVTNGRRKAVKAARKK